MTSNDEKLEGNWLVDEIALVTDAAVDENAMLRPRIASGISGSFGMFDRRQSRHYDDAWLEPVSNKSKRIALFSNEGRSNHMQPLHCSSRSSSSHIARGSRMLLVRPETRKALDRSFSGIDLRRVAMTLLVVALLGLAIGLAIMGLDALNDLLARGFTSLRTPTG